jgi:hypothetical protein
MSDYVNENFKAIITEYLLKNESDVIFGNEKLRKILQQDSEPPKKGLFSMVKKDKPKAKPFACYDLETSEYIDLTDVVITKQNEIYCVIGNLVGFVDDKFFFTAGIRNGFNSKSLIDLSSFVDVKIKYRRDSYPYFSLENWSVYNAINVDSSDDPYEYLKPAVTGDLDLIIEHVESIQKLMKKFLKDKKNSELELRRGEIVDEVSGAGGDSVDLLSCEDFEKLMKESQSSIIAIDRTFIQKFVKTSLFLKTKRENINRFFGFAKRVGNISDLEEIYELIKDEKYKYELILFNALSMLVSLLDDDMITFYEIYELFDKFGIFNSNWENETSQKLSTLDEGIEGLRGDIQKMDRNICAGLRDILYQNQQMEKNIVGAINTLTFVSSAGFAQLNTSISTRLESINSNLRIGNLLSGIQTYQNMRRIRQ